MVKDKHESQRIYDNEGYKMRAACVCVKNEHENEVLLISSSRHKNCWIIPGGGIENDENPENAAEREVYEEAGVQGRLGRLLGIFEVFENKERKHRTNVYLLIVDKELDDWEEHKKLGRIRKWFNLEEAKSELEKHKPIQGSYLNLLKGFNNNNDNINRSTNYLNNSIVRTNNENIMIMTNNSNFPIKISTTTATNIMTHGLYKNENDNDNNNDDNFIESNSKYKNYHHNHHNQHHQLAMSSFQDFQNLNGTFNNYNTTTNKDNNNLIKNKKATTRPP